MITIEKMLLLLDGIVDGFTAFWDLINKPLSEIFVDRPAIIDILETYGLENSTLIWFMLGTGITIYLVIQFVIWLLNTVT